MDPYLVQRVILYHTELCLELHVSVEIKHTKIYKLYLRFIEKILYKYIDFVLKVL
jgi:hypothetical protein